jgi:hypothetical protein
MMREVQPHKAPPPSSRWDPFSAAVLLLHAPVPSAGILFLTEALTATALIDGRPWVVISLSRYEVVATKTIH